MTEGSRPAPPKRVRVTHPRASAPRGPSSGQAARELEEQSVVGELLIRSLVGEQLRLALRAVVVFSCLLGGLPLLFAVSPGARTARLLGLPLPWLVLGGLVYPVLVAGGWVYTRLAERNEREFLDVVNRS